MNNQVPSPGSENFGDLSQDEQKKLLLEHYSGKPSTQFGQLDGFIIGVGKGDSVMHPDDDGDFCSGGCTHELMFGADVRILIKKGTSSKDAIRLITKLLEWFKSDYANSTNGVINDLSKILDAIPELDKFFSDITTDDMPF